MAKYRPTVADIRAAKGKRQMTMLWSDNADEVAAASAAGIDMLSIDRIFWSPEMRALAGNCFVQVGLPYGVLITAEDYLRAAHEVMRMGADCVYCAASVATIHRLADEGIPVVGHSGLIPSKATWTGGFRAVGKTADSAMNVLREVMALEAAGAFAVELEVVPDRVTREISARTSLIVLSMGSGTGGDAQYLFSEDVLGYTRGHLPRHAKVYRDFRSEFDRLQDERIAAFGEFRSDIEQAKYPAGEHLVSITDGEFNDFMRRLEADG